MVSFLCHTSQYMNETFPNMISCCEYNHLNNNFTKSNKSFLLDTYFQKNFLGKLEQFFFIDFSKKKNLCMIYINSINNTNVNKIKGDFSEKKVKQKPLFKFSTNFFDQKKSYLPEINFFFVYKSKHQGCIEKKLNTFVNNNTIVRLIILKENFTLILKNLQKKNILNVVKWSCFLTQKRKVYFSKIVIKILKTNKKYLNSSCYKYFFESPPCINCSSINNCHPQSIISPFECCYISLWNYKKGLFLFY